MCIFGRRQAALKEQMQEPIRRWLTRNAIFIQIFRTSEYEKHEARYLHMLLTSLHIVSLLLRC
jgi:hypothetical protein